MEELSPPFLASGQNLSRMGHLSLPVRASSSLGPVPVEYTRECEGHCPGELPPVGSLTQDSRILIHQRTKVTLA